jgi:hypothetical protein
MPETRQVAEPEVRQAAVQLMKLQLLPKWVRHGIEYAPAAERSFAARRGCCSEVALAQQDRGMIRLLRHAGLVCT